MHNALKFLALAAVVRALLAFVSPAQAEQKLAFVVGINTYKNLSRERQLSRAVADARSVSDTLKTIGFDVTLLTDDTTHEFILRRFGQFVQRLNAGDTALVYFAGHGIGLSGTNYLLPSDVPSPSGSEERLIRSRSIAETDLIDDIRERKAGVAIAILDACRDNPFPRTGSRSLGLSRGLEIKEPAEGVFSIYSAGLGQQAWDSLPDDTNTQNSVFTRVLIEQLRKPGVHLIDLGETVREEVAALTRRTDQVQVPAVYNQVLGARRIFLAGALPPSPVIREAPRPSAQPQALQSQAALPSAPQKTEAQSRAIEACDRLAASKFDFDRPFNWPSVAFDEIDGANATKACAIAVEAEPTNRRLAMQYGRSLSAANKESEAELWYRKAAEAGNALAMFNLADTLKERDKKSYKYEIVKWLGAAAALDHWPSMHALGKMYIYQDDMVSIDIGKGRELLERAANHDRDGEVAFSLAQIYSQGRGVAINRETANKWYQKAIDDGNVEAMNHRGRMLLDGFDGKIDGPEGKALLIKAVNKGSSDAAINLGRAFLYGNGLPTDKKLAREYFLKAKKMGHDEADMYLAELRGAPERGDGWQPRRRR